MKTTGGEFGVGGAGVLQEVSNRLDVNRCVLRLTCVYQVLIIVFVGVGEKVSIAALYRPYRRMYLRGEFLDTCHYNKISTFSKNRNSLLSPSGFSRYLSPSSSMLSHKRLSHRRLCHTRFSPQLVCL